MEKMEIPVTLMSWIFLNFEFSVVQMAKEYQNNWNELMV